MLNEIKDFIKTEPAFYSQEGLYMKPVSNHDSIITLVKPSDHWDDELKTLDKATKYRFPSSNPKQYLNNKGILPANMYLGVIDNFFKQNGGEIYWMPSESVYVEDEMTAVLLTKTNPDDSKAVAGFNISSFAKGLDRGNVVRTYVHAKTDLFDVNSLVHFSQTIKQIFYGMWIENRVKDYWFPYDIIEDIKYEAPNEIKNAFSTTIEQIVLIEKGLVPNGFRN